MKRLFLFLVSSVISVATFAQTKFTTDPMHSFVNFSIRHSGISLINGTFKKFNGEFTASKTDLTDAKINFTVEVGSVSTNVDMRDNHLKSADFFDAEKYPQMKFESTSFKKVRPNTYELTGKLTIKDVTKDVTFGVVYGGEAKDQQGNTKVGFLATGKIDRLDYHINYDPTGAGIGKDVNISLNLQFVKGK